MTRSYHAWKLNLPQPWKKELVARREVLAARFDERGHLLAATPPEWAQKLGPVPARPDAAQEWRDTAASIEMCRARCKVPDMEATPVPERFRNEEIGQQLHAQAVTVSKRSHALPEHTTEEDRTMDALRAVERSKDTLSPESPAQRATDADRQTSGQERAAITPEQTEKPRLRSRLEKIRAERNAARLAAQQQAQPQTSKRPRRKKPPSSKPSVPHRRCASNSTIRDANSSRRGSWLGVGHAFAAPQKGIG